MGSRPRCPGAGSLSLQSVSAQDVQADGGCANACCTCRGDRAVNIQNRTEASRDSRLPLTATTNQNRWQQNTIKMTKVTTPNATTLKVTTTEVHPPRPPPTHILLLIPAHICARPRPLPHTSCSSCAAFSLSLTGLARTVGLISSSRCCLMTLDSTTGDNHTISSCRHARGRGRRRRRRSRRERSAR